MRTVTIALIVFLAFAGYAGDCCWSAVIDFEGIGNLSGVGTVNGTTFGIAWVGLVDSDAGGGGDFANEPSPSTVAVLLNTTELQQSDTRITFPGLVRTVNFSYSYDNSSGPTTAYFYDQGNNLVGSINLNSCGSPVACGATCSGDPNGFFCKWTPFSFSGDNIAYMEIDLSTALNSFLIDNFSYEPMPTPVPAADGFGMLVFVVVAGVGSIYSLRRKAA